MLNKSSLLQASPYILAIACTVALGTQSALATKLTGAPLPYERETKEFNESNSIVIPPSASRFQRRLDYREEEKLKKQQDADAAKKVEQQKLDALEAVKKAQAQQIENAKQYQQIAIDANNSAVAFGKQGRWNEAIIAHEKAVQYDPGNKQFKINLSAARTAYGQQRLAAHDFVGAAHLFRQSLAAAADNSMAAKLLSEALKKQGIDPGSPDQRLELSDKLLGANDLVGASIEIQQAMALEQSARVYQKMGDLFVRYGQVTNAMAYYRQAIVKDADYGPAHRQLAFLQMSKNDFTAAAASLRKAVICDSKDVAAGQALVELWRKQVAQNPLLAENHLGLAGAMQLTGDFQGAEGEYRRLEALDPRNPGLESGRASLNRSYKHAICEKHKMAAETLFSQGLRREALGEINLAVSEEPRNARYQFLLGECLEGLGDYAGAHRAYLTCVLIDPENQREAAFRIKEMQKAGGISNADVAKVSGQIGNDVSRGYSSGQPQQPQMQQQPSPQQQQAMQQQAMQQAAMQQQTQAQQMQQQQQFAAQPPGSFRVAQPEAAPQQPMPQMQEQSNYPQKSMFEGGSQNQAFNPNAMNFRTHDESQQAQQAIEQERQQQLRQQAAMQAQQAQQQAAMQAQQAQQQAQQPAQPAAANDPLSQISVLESQKDYQGAVNLLRQMADANVENAEIHHRLATNLLNLGQVAEAIPEFRIASALKPAVKAYSDDLARAMAIHKRSLMSDKDSSGGSK